jgi:hypothetical protein
MLLVLIEVPTLGVSLKSYMKGSRTCIHQVKKNTIMKYEIEGKNN